ncbi:hypothetical protein TcYC6_0010280 [Trypanosoma cruzi]|nr:hypothetical protein TcYC6_0010280 [Trypanosoma cruzi]
MRLTSLRGRPSLSWNGEVRNDCRDVDCVAFMGTTRLQATSGAQPEESLTAQTAVKKRQRSLSANDARPWYDESPTSPLWDQLHEERERGGARTVCAVKAGAEECP